MLPACNPNNNPQPLITDTTKITDSIADSIIDTVRDTVDTIIQDTTPSPVMKKLVDMYKSMGLLPTGLKSYSLKAGEIDKISYYDEVFQLFVTKQFNSSLSEEGLLVYDVQGISDDGAVEYSRDTITETEDGIKITTAWTKKGKPPELATGWSASQSKEWIYEDGGITSYSLLPDGSRLFYERYVADGSNNLNVIGSAGNVIGVLSDYIIEQK